MDFGVANWSFLFRLVMLVFLLACGSGTSESGQMMRSIQKNIMDLVHGNPHHIFHDHHNQGRPHHDQTHLHMHVGDSSSSETGAYYSPFFTTTDLKSGARMAQKFPPDLGATASYFLPKDEADSIPFSPKKLPEILSIFSLAPGSRQAKDVEDSLRLCEGRPIEGETKFCATSVESLTNLVHRFFGTSETGHRGLSLLASTFLDRPKTAFQNFTVLGAPEEVAATKMMGCHVMVYPYAVFYCHHQGGRDGVFKVLLRGDNGDRVKAVAACHDIISKWDPNLTEFRKVRLPERPLCHFFPPHGNLVWVFSNNSASA